MRIVAAGGADISITSPLQAAGADALTNSTSGIPTYDLLSGFNGATWDRLRALGDDSDGVATASLGRFLALARLSAFNGSTYDRLLSEGNDRDAIANTTLGSLQTLGFQHVYNGATWDRATLLTDASDAVATDTSFGQGGISRPSVFNGATWDRQRSLSATALNGLGQASVSLAVPAAGVVQTLLFQHGSSSTRATAITPASGKRLRIISAQVNMDGNGGDATSSIYFGTGAGVGTDKTKAVAHIRTNLAAHHNESPVWGDGAGAVGAVDEVLSVNNDVSADVTAVWIVTFREE